MDSRRKRQVLEAPKIDIQNTMLPPLSEETSYSGFNLAKHLLNPAHYLAIFNDKIITDEKNHAGRLTIGCFFVGLWF